MTRFQYQLFNGVSKLGIEMFNLQNFRRGSLHYRLNITFASLINMLVMRSRTTEGARYLYDMGEHRPAFLDRHESCGVNTIVLMKEIETRAKFFNFRDTILDSAPFCEQLTPQSHPLIKLPLNCLKTVPLRSN